MYTVRKYLEKEKLKLPEKASTTTVSLTKNCESPRVCHLLVGQVLGHARKVSCVVMRDPTWPVVAASIAAARSELVLLHATLDLV